MTPVNPKVDPGIIFGPFVLMNPRWSRWTPGWTPGSTLDHIWTLVPVGPETLFRIDPYPSDPMDRPIRWALLIRMDPTDSSDSNDPDGSDEPTDPLNVTDPTDRPIRWALLIRMDPTDPNGCVGSKTLIDYLISKEVTLLQSNVFLQIWGKHGNYTYNKKMSVSIKSLS